VVRVTDRPVVLCIAVLAAMVLVPALLFPLPPLIDYPNHLARIWLIAGGVHVPPMDGFYFEDWRGVGAGIGIDAMAKLLSPILPPSGIGLVLLMMAILLPPLGCSAGSMRGSPISSPSGAPRRWWRDFSISRSDSVSRCSRSPPIPRPREEDRGPSTAGASRPASRF
jgi:hypothetical protein